MQSRRSQINWVSTDEVFLKLLVNRRVATRGMESISTKFEPIKVSFLSPSLTVHYNLSAMTKINL
ncbi:hypothetical protein CPB83DRAFT_855205 [Crepidotus variabilis]|uniref:Uncharacterized protein n=1 Tax=Crepidotus variabilis TaxID=179855 RepID=A0A9P6EFM3_9AGAR|nr:hypothetical protein CPB83DRAFT_855205 [Crepidotus variabilis]